MIKTLNALRTVESTPYRKRRHHVSVFFAPQGLPGPGCPGPYPAQPVTITERDRNCLD